MPSHSRCIDFVILTWNSERVIVSCLVSVLNMECTHRIYVVDNGSGDCTANLVRETAKKHPEGRCVTLIQNQENRGTTIARNQALRQINQETPYVCILDSDTEVNAYAFEAMMSLLDNRPDCMLTGPALKDKQGVPQSAARRYPTPANKLMRALPFDFAQKKSEAMEKMGDNLHPYEADYLLSACWLMKREALDKVGYLDEKIFFAPEDVEYCTRLRLKGYRIVHCPEVSILHHWQRLSKKKLLSRHNMEHIKGLLYLWRKYGFTGRGRGRS